MLFSMNLINIQSMYLHMHMRVFVLARWDSKLAKESK